MEDGTLGTCTIEACVENPIIIVSESNTKQGMLRMIRAINLLYATKSYHVMIANISSLNIQTQMSA